jgi:hypothetical protein
MVEQWTENSCVTGSSPVIATKCDIQHKFMLLLFKHGILCILYNSVLIKWIQYEFSRGGPVRVRHVGLVAECGIQLLHSVSKFVWNHIVFNAPLAELVDAPDLGSGIERCESSSLLGGTKLDV